MYNIVTWIKMDIITTLQNSRNGHYIHIYESKNRYYSHFYAYSKYGHNNHLYRHTVPPVQPHILYLIWVPMEKISFAFVNKEWQLTFPFYLLDVLCLLLIWIVVGCSHVDLLATILSTMAWKYENIMYEFSSHPPDRTEQRSLRVSLKYRDFCSFLPGCCWLSSPLALSYRLLLNKVTFYHLSIPARRKYSFNG